MTGWNGEIVDPGEFSHVSQSSRNTHIKDHSVESTLSSTGCFIGTEWLLTLYLHDAEATLE